VLRYKVLRSANGRSLLAVELITGRTHQIRVQCAGRGFPIVGDGKYGKGRKGEQLALCAVKIAFGGRVFEIDKKFEDFD
jgi:23S rRNA-/tRNA-specific pseudouridylate synthase